ncbi:MAG: hypothetical protein H0W86_01440 [Armatimonadetes bacterium]|nr:hypothetical protein [Armatimonadota bacterium]
MKFRRHFEGSIALAALCASVVGVSDEWYPLPRAKERASPEYTETIRKTATMVGNPEAQRLANARGLNILNVTWEDTGRFKNSAVGPNISDMTIQVDVENPLTRQFEVTCMPVIRYPNYSDLTCDFDPRGFTLLVGNEKGRPLKRVILYQFLENPTAYLAEPSSWRGRGRSLAAPRDTHALVSAQACFLPIPKSGKATFNPVLFNYQSVSGDPAVLTILCTREGTSTTIIDNKRDPFSTGSVWGQRLFHNANGERASLTGERLSDFISKGLGSGKGPGLSMVLLVQVPLKQKHPMRGGGGFGGGGNYELSAPSTKSDAKVGRSDVEAAVIGHGEVEGPFTEIDNLAIERHPNFPVRVTVQFYKATSNGVVSEADMTTIKKEIEQVYSLSDYVGSLVTQGETGRPTEYVGMKVQPPGWWDEFWLRHQQNTGDSREEALAKLMKLLGKNYMQRPICELYLRDCLRK